MSTRERGKGPAILTELLGESQGIVALREKVTRLLERQLDARRLPPILIQGGTGSGKGLLARAIHQAGPRAGGPFVDVNCAAIPETLLEAELFGFERGAFTDARQAKAGLFQAAHRGTIFLDEVGLLPEGSQGKLLTVLEEREVRRLGSTRSEPVDVWVLAATSLDMEGATRARRFREDLYHRLAVLTLTLPPLRERGRDVVLLAEHFLALACRDYGLAPKVLGADARDALLAYAWPGNIRELANVLERVALLTDEPVVTAEMLGLPAAAAPPPALAEVAPLREPIGSAEREHVLEALRRTNWNISRAAARLGISRNTLRYRMEKYGLRPGAAPGPAPPLERPERPAPAVHPTAPTPVPEVTVVRWERRQLALLGVTLLTPPEEALHHASRALEEIIQKVRAFGGRAEEMSPTAVMAVFGIEPVEDASRRAALAGLAIQKVLERAPGEEPAPTRGRIAIHAGQLVVGEVGGGAQIDFQGKREAWSVVETLTRRAEPGSILVSAAAAEFLARRFELLPVPAAEWGAPRVYRLAGRERTGFELWGRMGKFVGRQQELELLRSRWAAVPRGHGQVVGIVGEAGIGKSRLLFEFRLGVVGEGIKHLEASCHSYGSRIPYLPVVQLFKSYFQLDERDELPAIQEKVVGKVLALDLALKDSTPAFLALVNALPEGHPLLTFDLPQRRQQILDGIKRLLLRESQLQPLLLVIEDLHWVDSETQAVLDTLVDSLPGARLLLVVSYRPDYQHDWGRKGYYTQLALEPLPPETTEELLEALVGTDATLAPVKRLLIERTEGNPFFLEESVRTLVETRLLTGAPGGYRLAKPVEALQVPTTVQAVLAARLDRLPATEKRLLQCAAVIGKHVSVPLLQAIVGLPDEAVRGGLGHLLAGEFFYEARVLPEVEYTFKHALTHEVAYGSLLDDGKRVLHARVVEAIERLYGDHLLEHAEALAHHAIRGEAWEKAVDYLREAGAKAYARAALLETLDRYEQALALLPRLPASSENTRRAIDVRLDLHVPLLVLGQVPRLLQLYQEAEQLARQLNDPHRLARVFYRIALTSWLDGRYADGMAYARQAFAAAESLDDPGVRVLVTYALGLNHHALGSYRDAIELLTRVVDGPDAELAKRLLAVTVSAYIAAASWLTYCLAIVGEFERALQYARRGVDGATVSEHPQAQAIAYTFLAVALAYRGEWVEALPWCERAVQLCESKGLLVWLPVAYSTLGWVLAGAGRAVEGVPHLERGVTLTEAMGVKTYVSLLYVRWAEGLLRAGRVHEAQRSADRALELAMAAGERGNEAQALHVRGRVAAAADPPEVDGARGFYERARAEAEELGMRPLVAHCHLDFARLARQAGQHGEAETHLGRAVELFRELGMRGSPGEGGTALGA